MSSLRSLLVVLSVVSVLPACSLWPRISGEERRAQEQARRLGEVQRRCQRFADTYAGHVLETVAPIAHQTRNVELISRLTYWELTQLNSAYTIASGPSPVACYLDFVVLATLSRMVVEDTLVEFDRDRTQPLPAAYRELEKEAWSNAATVLTEPQLAELRGLIADWRSKNPQITLVGFVHFAEFAQAAGGSASTRGGSSSLFGLIGLDPLAGLDPAVRQIEQTRLLAERMIFYMQRVPYLMDLQTERVVSQATLTPEVGRANASLERASHAMAEYATIGTNLPQTLARERDALIRQLSGEMLAQEAELRELLIDVQTTLAAGSGTADAVEDAVAALDRLMARFPKREPGDRAAQGRPFDITEYTAAAVQFHVAARQLTQLVETLERTGRPMAIAVEGGVAAGRDLADYLFWRILLLGSLLIAATLAAAIAFRALHHRDAVSR